MAKSRPKLIRPEEAATILGKSTATIRKYANRGLLKAVQVPPRGVRYVEAEVLDLARQQGVAI